MAHIKWPYLGYLFNLTIAIDVQCFETTRKTENQHKFDILYEKSKKNQKGDLNHDFFQKNRSDLNQINC